VTGIQNLCRSIRSLDPAVKEKVLAFLAIKSLEQLEQILIPVGGEKLARGSPIGAGCSRGFGDGTGAFRRGRPRRRARSAYYTGFVFEAFDRKGELRAIAGGGRYNNLVAKLGGPDLPAVGFAIAM